MPPDPTLPSYSPPQRESGKYGDITEDPHSSDPQHPAMWWADGYWMVGTRSAVGEGAGYLSVLDSAMTPESIVNEWKVS